MLLAALVGTMLVMILGAGVSCMVVTIFGRAEVGACIKAGVAEQIREVWELALTSILALLLASRNGRGPPTKPPDDEGG